MAAKNVVDKSNKHFIGMNVQSSYTFTFPSAYNSIEVVSFKKKTTLSVFVFSKKKYYNHVNCNLL